MNKKMIGPLMIAVCLLAANFGISQTDIKNPSKPLAKNAGRTIILREIMRIKDDGKETIFRGPSDLQIGEDGAIYFYDGLSLYEFDDNGKLMAAMVRSGQGPGEASMRTTSVIMNDKINTLSIAPPKFMVFDRSGRLLEEVKTDVIHNYGHFGLGGKMWIFRIMMPPGETRPANGGEMDVTINLEKFSLNLKEIEKVAEFPRRYYFVNQGMWYEWANFGWAMKEPSQLFVHHTSEYRIVQFNITKKAIERIFSREYSRVVRPEDPPPKIPQGYSIPSRKYYDDIRALLVHRDRLWAVTSTKDVEKNRLVDVFDKDGRYVDCFYLKFPGGFAERNILPGRIAVRGDFLYMIDEDLEGFKSIGKYKIEDYGGGAPKHDSVLGAGAERAGFEPAVRFATHTRFPSALLKPLGHLSGAGKRQNKRIKYQKSAGLVNEGPT